MNGKLAKRYAIPEQAREYFRAAFCCIFLGFPIVLCLLVSLSGFVVLASQLLPFFQGGQWVPIPAERVAGFMADSSFALWLAEPEFWLGLHRLMAGFLSWCPASLFLIVAGPVLLVIYSILLCWILCCPAVGFVLGSLFIVLGFAGGGISTSMIGIAAIGLGILGLFDPEG